MTDIEILRRACELRGHTWQEWADREKCRYCGAERPSQWVDLGGFVAKRDGEPTELRMADQLGPMFTTQEILDDACGMDGLKAAEMIASKRDAQ